MAKLNEYSYQQVHDQKLAESISVAAIVQVTSFDSAKMTVNVQPLSKHLENGNYESQPPILSIPVACTRCGGFLFRPWYKAGDVGVVVYLDHDLDSTVSGGKEAVPLTERNHATSDAVFIGGIVAGSFAVSGLPDESIALATEDGSIYVAVTKSNIVLNGNVQVNGNVQIDGSLSATSDATVDGSITATGDVVSEGGISGAHHTHPGCQGGSTGQPR